MSSALKIEQALAADMFDAVRLGFETVAAAAEHVKIRFDRIPDYAKNLRALPPQDTYDLEHHYLGTPEATAAYSLVLEAVNFGSGYKSLLAQEGFAFIDDSLYFTVSTRLKHHFIDHGPLTASVLAAMTVGECAALFGLNTAKPAGKDMAELFTASLQELGSHITAHYRGSFLSFVESADGAAERMVRHLSGLSRFNDIHFYKGMQVPFYKRAQLAAATLNIEFARLGRTLFHDTARLTLFADNDVPHVLRTDGLLEYTPDLAAQIAWGTELPSGSATEIEIRACAGHVVELLSAQSGMAAQDIDFILWHRGRDGLRYGLTPCHRTRSRFY
ncbi:MAG TPA: queuosine salvage family protein [Alphaproteobacteria bacterium]